MEFRPFTIDVPRAELDELHERLSRTRWPAELQERGWERGTEVATMRRLVVHWLDGYDWRAQEERLNRFHHVVTAIDGRDLHAIHERAVRPGAPPILLLHGWADSFYRFAHVVDRLTGRDPAVGPDEPVFDVVVPSLPGFDFSEQPEAGTVSGAQSAEVVASLMAGLGYDRYLVHGGDWGGVVAQEVARAHPDRVVGLHLTDVPFPNLFPRRPRHGERGGARYVRRGRRLGRDARRVRRDPVVAPAHAVLRSERLARRSRRLARRPLRPPLRHPAVRRRPLSLIHI